MVLIALITINITFIGGFTDAKGNVSEEATCYSSHTYCKWWTQCFDFFKCGTCDERQGVQLEDSGTCTIG